MQKEFPKTYNPKEVEDKIYATWEKSGFFNPDNLQTKNIKKDKNGKEKTYTIILPPPNITDKLHLGHSSILATQDLLIRYYRMKGYRALWLPGTDHAGIATQNVVEKKLLKEKGLTRQDLGREKFLKEIWKFLSKTQSVILKQTKKMGSSLDWSRETFTLDEERKIAVKKMFIDMYEAGAIYRGERIINWCPRCKSTLADDEVEYKKQKTKLYTFKYSKNFPFTIATTRPETKLGDTAIAVNPNDQRYKKYIGKTYETNFCSVKLKLKIIADRHIEMDFGTGALGVTPAHSMIDWQMAEKNNLKIIKVIGEDGKIKDNFGEYSGKTVKDARKMIVKKLKKNNLLEKEEEIENNLSICYRCDTAIEPLPSKQWFISVNKKLDRLGGKSLKEKAIKVVKNKKIEFIPNRFEKRYFDWMENMRDWCISRQIWFGHRIPVWYQRSEVRNQKSDKKINLIMARHGKTDWNEKGIMQGQFDIPMNKLGEKTTFKLRDKFKNEKIDLIITSPLKRAKKTAEILNVNGVKIIEDDRLKEHYYGELQGKKRADVLKEDPNIKILEKNNATFWMEIPGGESYEDVRKRVNNFIEDMKKKYAGKTILVVSHEDPLDMIHAILNNISKIDALGTFTNVNDIKKYKILCAEKKIYVGAEPPKENGWTQDEDSLDTWFSSGMWTFSTLGWPNSFKNGKKLKDLAKFHPTQALGTGYEILTLWVSRMIMMSLFAVNEIPFEKVYLNGMVLDEYGKKMSKSKGNGIDPLDVIDKFGADAVRLSLLIGNTPGNDMRLSEEKIEGCRNFINKLWNISRYILQNQKSEIKDQKINYDNLTLSDKWILNNFDSVIDLEHTAKITRSKSFTEFLDHYDFSFAASFLQTFTLDFFADWYLEISKFEKTSEKNKILIYILKRLLILWHPFIPFATEKIWGNFNSKNLLMIEKWPTKKLKIPVDNCYFHIIQDIIKSIRNARSQYKVKSSQKIDMVIYSKNSKKLDLIKSQKHLIKNLRTGINKFKIKKINEKNENVKDVIYLTVSDSDIEIYLIGMIDKNKEKENLQKEINNLEKYLNQIKNKLDNKNFISKAPAEIVKIEKRKYKETESKLKKIQCKLK
ncbi:MAG: class I tRNA ligase family protein [Patescibacteria group bacterium]|nr:class I tRNA ligase family protein [Patescibacteria group bacterium]